jgi:hypothetical protein
MLIVPTVVKMSVMNAIVEAAHSMTTTTGDRRPMATIAPEALNTAALAALMIATGQTVISDDEKIVVRAPQPVAGPFVMG